MAFSAMLYLDAINEMLLNAGQLPVNSLVSIPSVDKAKAYLDSVNRSVQSMGWNFNTDRNRKLTPDASAGNIILPQDTLKCDTVGSSAYIGVTIRDNILRKTDYYDGEDPEVFTAPVYVDLVHFLDFETIPQAARYYITIKAARRYADASLASGTVHQFTALEEQQAMVGLEEAEGANGDYNMLNNMQYINRRTAYGRF